MRSLFVAVLFAGTVVSFSGANTADGCGPDCHSAQNGGCVIDGWGATAARNECPAGLGPGPVRRWSGNRALT
jgi:hypothetical protein